jgi:hypothetical protein
LRLEGDSWNGGKEKSVEHARVHKVKRKKMRMCRETHTSAGARRSYFMEEDEDGGEMGEVT